jgi:hypothetical protein
MEREARRHIRRAQIVSSCETQIENASLAAARFSWATKYSMNRRIASNVWAPIHALNQSINAEIRIHAGRFNPRWQVLMWQKIPQLHKKKKAP